MNIFKTLTESIWQFETSMFIEDVSLYFSIFERSINIIDLSNAGKTGQTCMKVSIQPNEWFSNYHECKDYFDVKMNGQFLRDWFDEIIKDNTAPEGKNYFNVEIEKGKMYFEQLKAVQVFSPFAKYKRLTKVPTKWTKAMLLKL